MAPTEESFNWKLHVERNNNVAEVWLFLSMVAELVFARKVSRVFFQQSGDCNQPHFCDSVKLSALSVLSNLQGAVTVRAERACEEISEH